MSKAILEFNLPEDQEEFSNASKAGAMLGVLWDFDQWLRSEIKYRDRNELQEVRDKFYEFLQADGIEL